MSYIKIDGAAIEKWAEDNDFTLSSVSEALGRNSTFVRKCITRGTMLDGALRLLREKYDLPEDAFVKKPEPPKPEPKQESLFAPSGARHTGYWLDLNVRNESLKVTLYFNSGKGPDQEVVSAYAKILGEGELDLIKSISYATHMQYKLAEQKELGK